jgi:hypothetical protein
VAAADDDDVECCVEASPGHGRQGTRVLRAAEPSGVRGWRQNLMAFASLDAQPLVVRISIENFRS